MKRLAICAICRNEKPYLLEWLAFYRLAGFADIYIYDNVSDDGTSEMLAALDALGHIRRIFFPRREKIPPQRDAYNHFLENHAYRHDYVLVVDLDEFLFVHDTAGIQGLIARAEAKHGEVAAIAFPWQMFGSDGAERMEPGLVIERFRKTAPQPDTTVKTLFNPAHTYNFRTHISNALDGVYLTSALKPYKFDPKMPIRMLTPDAGEAVIHHYYTKSREEWGRKIRMARVNRAQDQKRRESKFEETAHFDLVNDAALPFIAPVKAGIAQLGADLRAFEDRVTPDVIRIVGVDPTRLFGTLTYHGPAPRLPMVRIVADDAAEYLVAAQPTQRAGVHVFTLRRKWKPKMRMVTLSVVGAATSVRVDLDSQPPLVPEANDRHSLNSVLGD
ncbi:hypothetical protein OCGS_1057 [Oceaniovalibus guishaninsula JLT2003]|uniref:Glycosyl transferase family 2 n=1 Tax=Oceaniovalibus guishaninsula JLT2003 TaxID=1231392 RepID=K2HPN5_9RHOB|nr:glycosyltransferase family 2 protein [Oceaniovalibus guishaninsula]EKE44824.1 hypothetical protein OCGS_1057 [Oceaniovalibus guishaninsula JLT2003]